jgi:hypothetical protein
MINFLLRCATFAFIAIPAPLVSADAIPLFDGKTLDGWQGADGLWRVEDGAITGETRPDTKMPNSSFLVWTKGIVNDFVIEFDYRILSDWANSGLQYRSQRHGDQLISGYQADIESGTTYTGVNYSEHTGRELLARRGQRAWLGDGQTKRKVEQFADGATLQASINGKGQWNRYRIAAIGATMTHSINGVLMSEVIDESEAHAVKEGILAFQLHSGPPMKIQFKNVVLTPLK